MLAEKSIQTAEDLLYHSPSARRPANPRSLDELVPAKWPASSAKSAARRSCALAYALFEVTIGQGRFALSASGSTALPRRQVPCGQTVAVYGKVEPSRSSSNFKMMQPQFEILPDASADAEPPPRSRPHYACLRIARWQPPRIPLAAQSHLQPARKPARRRAECLRNQCSIASSCPTRNALREVHYPPKARRFRVAEFLNPSSPPDLRRVVLPRTGPRAQARRMKERQGIASPPTTRCARHPRVLPFHPTAAQKRALGEIVADMRAPSPCAACSRAMWLRQNHRRFQAMLVAMENGYQAALMAPTEILASSIIWPRANCSKNPRASRASCSSPLTRRGAQTLDRGLITAAKPT